MNTNEMNEAKSASIGKADKNTSSSEKKESTRSYIAQLYVWAFFYCYSGCFCDWADKRLLR